MDLDDFQRELKGISLYQVGCLVAISLNMAAAGPMFISGSFLSAVPRHRCKTIYEGNGTFLNETEIDFLFVEKCERKDYNYTECPNLSPECFTAQDPVDSIPCDDGYIYSNEYYEETTVSEWDLVCGRRTLDSLANSLFFFGFFIGSGVCGIVSDWYGRKYSLLAFCVIMNGVNVAVSFVPWYELYVGLRLLAASATIATYLTGFTLSTELVSTAHRIPTSVFIFIFNSSVGMVLPGFAYALRDWRNWYLVVALFGLPFLILFFVIPESPRWLLLQNKTEDAKHILKKCFKSKKRVFTEEKWEEVVRTEKEKLVKTEKKEKLSYLDLFRYPLTRVVTLNVLLCWFTVSMVNYGLVLNITSLAGDPYLNAALNSVMSIAGNFSTIFCHKFGRRYVQSVGYFAAGLCCLLSMVLAITAGGNEAQTTASVTFALIGKLFTSLTFGMIYIVTAEAYPTSVRATGMGIGSMAARVGSMFTPFTLQLQYNVPWLTQSIFGTLSIIAGFSTLIFPETRGVDYISTLKEAENFYRSDMKKTAAFLRIKPLKPMSGIENPAMENEKSNQF